MSMLTKSNAKLIDRAQRMFYARLRKGNPVYLTSFSDGASVFLTNGTFGILIPVDRLLLNPAAFCPFQPDTADRLRNSILLSHDTDQLLDKTDALICVNDKLFRRFTPENADEGDVCIEENVADLFSDFRLFWDSASGRVIAVDEQMLPVGILMPLERSNHA